MSDERTELAERASFLRAGIAMGLLTAGDAIAWADETLARHSAVPPDLLALSVTPSHDEVRVRELLGDLAGTTFGEEESDAVVGALFDLLLVELDSGVRSHAGVMAVLGHASQALPLAHDLKLALWQHHADFAMDHRVSEHRTRALLAPFSGARRAFLHDP